MFTTERKREKTSTNGEKEKKPRTNHCYFCTQTKEKNTSNNYPSIHTNEFFFFLVIDNIICKKNLRRNDLNPTKIND